MTELNWIDFTWPSPAENLACEEVLLDWCESGETRIEHGLIRFWEPDQPFVVLGYSNRAATEVNLEFCQEQGIPVLRRCSGGGTVLQAPGCLNYCLLLRVDLDPALHTITGTNQWIMQRQREALAGLVPGKLTVSGHTDLALDNLKVSGNAQRRRRNWVLFHGAILLRLDLPLMESTLRMPSRQPGYRRKRSHRDFVTSLNLPRAAVVSALRQHWNAQIPLSPWPTERVQELALTKYTDPNWNLKW